MDNILSGFMLGQLRQIEIFDNGICSSIDSDLSKSDASIPHAGILSICGFLVMIKVCCCDQDCGRSTSIIFWTLRLCVERRLSITKNQFGFA